MDIPSLKKYIVSGLLGSVSTEELNSNNLILTTASGTIIGKPVLDIDIEELKKNFNSLSNKERGIITVYTLIESFAESYREEYSVDFPTSGNDGYLLLKDVTIKNSGADTTVPIMAVFYDQIIGVSFGNI